MVKASKKIKLDDHCGTSEDFKSKRAFQNHCRCHDKAVYQCDQCSVKFNTTKLISRHKFEYHSANKKCHQCSKTYLKASSLKKHEETHDVQYS